MTPDFPESQIQSYVNQYISTRIFGRRRILLHPIIISPDDEHYLGWDTGFDLPWLPLRHNTNHGCNLFIQYKRAKQITSDKGAEWRAWQEAYYKFKFFYSKKDSATNLQYEDFTQYDQMRALASEGYLSLYISNSTLERAVLLRGDPTNPLKYCVAINVADITSAEKHRCATYTTESSAVILHSKPETIKPFDIGSFLAGAKEQFQTNLDEDIKKISKILRTYEEVNRISDEQSYTRRYNEDLPIAVRYVLSAIFLKRYLDISWLRV